MSGPNWTECDDCGELFPEENEHECSSCDCDYCRNRLSPQNIWSYLMGLKMDFGDKLSEGQLKALNLAIQNYDRKR